VVFDCDGLLLETESRWTIAEQVLLERRGVPWSQDLKDAMLGTSLSQSSVLLARFAGLPDEDAPALGEELMAEYTQALAVHGVEPMPGVRELLQRLDGQLPLAVASNTLESYTRAALAASGLPPFHRALVCAGGEHAPKPAPDVYLAACLALGVEPAGAIAFEDSQPGCDAARAAGLWTIGVPSQPGQTLEADETLASLLELDTSALLGASA
jgi:HAD superfamily hydrolase (TIGR01509 family)